MADCELCGAMKVGTRNVMMGRAQVQACTRCIEKLGLEQKKVAPGLAAAKGTNATSGGYGGIGKKGKEIIGICATAKKWLRETQSFLNKA